MKKEIIEMRYLINLFENTNKLIENNLLFEGYSPSAVRAGAKELELVFNQMKKRGNAMTAFEKYGVNNKEHLEDLINNNFSKFNGEHGIIGIPGPEARMLAGIYGQTLLKTPNLPKKLVKAITDDMIKQNAVGDMMKKKGYTTMEQASTYLKQQGFSDDIINTLVRQESLKTGKAAAATSKDAQAVAATTKDAAASSKQVQKVMDVIKKYKDKFINAASQKGMTFKRLKEWTIKYFPILAVGSVVLTTGLIAFLKENNIVLPDTPKPTTPSGGSSSGRMKYTNCSDFPFKFGCINPKIAEIQQKLRVTPTRGYFGPITRTALGGANTITLDMYNNIMNSGASSGPNLKASDMPGYKKEFKLQNKANVQTPSYLNYNEPAVKPEDYQNVGGGQ